MLYIYIIYCSHFDSSTPFSKHSVAYQCRIMAENRAAKLQKLNHFRRKLPHVSVRALGAIATAIAEEGAPDGLQNRNELRAARDSICKKTGPYGPILDHASVSGKEGGMISIALANPYNILKSFK